MQISAGTIREQIERRRLQAQQQYDLTPLWRADAWKKLTAAGVTGPLRQAGVFAAMLEQMQVCVFPDEALIGSTQGALSDRLPPGTEETAYEDAVRLVNTEIKLSFAGHFDHACPDYDRLLAEGLAGVLARIDTRLEHEAGVSPDQRDILHAMAQALRAFGQFILRHAAACRESGREQEAQRLEHIASNPPENVWDALQLVWLVDLVFALEGRGAMAFGRMDQYLNRFYQSDTAAGRLTREEALQLIGHFYAKLSEPLRRNAINNISVGGCTPTGSDATNAVSYLLLEAAEQVRSPHHNLTARWHRQTPQSFRRACLTLMETGIGFPAVVNDDVLAENLMRLGYPPEDAYNSCFVGCIETFFPGKTGPWADSRLNMLKVVEDTLLHPTASLPTYAAFEAHYLQRLEEAVAAHAERIRLTESSINYWEKSAPFLSALVQDCIDRGQDINAGGAVYPAMHGIAGMGLATVADSLHAVEVAVYEEQRWTLAQLRSMLEQDFVGNTREQLYLLHRIPKYGNGEPRVDGTAKRVADTFGQAVLAEVNALSGRMLPLLAANVQNIAAGAEVGATPDGRRAGAPVSDAASPHFGRDRNSLVGVAASLAQIDYINSVGGNVVNLKLTFSQQDHDQQINAFIALITTYFQQGGMQVQVNTVDHAELRRAQKNPADYTGLLVRVSGFSAYFTQLGRAVQDDIIARTQHRVGEV